MTDATMEGAASGKDKGAEKPKSSSKMLMIIGALAVLLGGGAGAYFFLFAPKAAPAEHKEEKKVTGFLEIKEMLIGMAADTAQPSVGPQRFMKLHVMLEVSDAKKVPALQALQPRIEDMFQVYLRELRPADLQGSAAIFRLKEELLRRVNLAVSPERVDAVLIKELLLQ
jgi:flagellar FliL protein